MELEIGNYARINEDSRAVCLGIGKITNIVQDTVYLQMDKRFNMPISFQKNQIANASHNPIDLIEVGDYVNGELVPTTFEKDELSEGVLAHVVTKSGNYIFDDDIESIVTKEQFEQMSYKIGEK